jgi:hypothetical protein
MKKLVLLLAILLPGLAWAQAAVVQSNQNDSGSSGVASLGVAFTTANITTSNYVIVSCTWFNTGQTVTVTDNASGGSNTYTDTGSSVATNSTTHVQTFKAKIVNGGGTKPTVTCNFAGGGASFPGLTIAEVSGADGTTFVDTSANATSSPAVTLTITAGTLTTSANNDLIYAACSNGNVPPLLGGGYALINQTSSSTGLTAEAGVLNTAVSGTYVPTVADPNQGAQNYACNAVAIKSANQTATAGVTRGNIWAQQTDATSTTRSWTHTTASATNSLLVVTLHSLSSQSGVAPTVTYNSVSMTNAGHICYNSTNYGAVCDVVFYKTAPPTGAHTVAVTYSNTTAGEEESEDFADVNQTTPITGIQSEAPATPLSTSTVTVTSALGDWVSSHIAYNAGLNTIAVGGTLVQDWQAKLPATGLFVGDAYAPGAASVTSTWTSTSAVEDHAQIAFDIAAAVAPPTHVMPPVVY